MTVHIDHLHLGFPLDLNVGGVEVIKAEGDTLLTLSSLSLSPSLRPLFDKQIEIPEIQLSGLNLNYTDSTGLTQLKAKLAEAAVERLFVDLDKEHVQLGRLLTRGGDVTYHGPGQLTGYPILDLERFHLGLKAYIELLEQSVIELLKFYRIEAGLKDGATGVWLDVGNPTLERKICAIGVKSSRYVTMHGFALNVNNDLAPFQLINPCGFKQGKVASIAQEVGHEVDFTVVKHMLVSILHRRLHEHLTPRY